MGDSFTFEQSQSQRNILWVILGFSAVFFLGMMVIFAIFGNDSPMTLPIFLVWAAIIMVVVFRVVRGTLVEFSITLESEGFSVKNNKSGLIAQYGWEDVYECKVGNLTLDTGSRSYLRIWIKHNGPAYFLEDDGTDPERSERFEAFVSVWTKRFPFPS